MNSDYRKGFFMKLFVWLAAKWYRKAAEQGDAGAQCLLGISYDEGRGVEQSDTEAAKWWRKAARQGHKEAKSMLEALQK